MLERGVERRVEVQALAVLRDQLFEPGLPDRDAALSQTADLRLVDVDAEDL
jgi:hypothetical protein